MTADWLLGLSSGFALGTFFMAAVSIAVDRHYDKDEVDEA